MPRHIPLDLSVIQADVATVKSDVGTIKSDTATIKSDTATIKSDIATVKSNTSSLIKTADTPKISNVTMTNANAEYEHTFQTGCRKFLLHTRDGTAFRIAFVTGKVAAPTEPYFSVPLDQSYYEDYVNLAAGTKIYFACASAGKVVEILEWK